MAYFADPLTTHTNKETFEKSLLFSKLFACPVKCIA
jgi:hypothetical protein